MNGPYREAGAKLPPVVPARLDCRLRDGDRGRWIRSIYVKGALTATACSMVTAMGAPLAAIPLVLMGLLWAHRDWKGRKGAGVAFVVSQGRLVVQHDGHAFDLDIDELHEVRLDTKSTTKNVTMSRADGMNTIFGQASNHNIALDVSRIELTFADDERVILGPDWISHSLCSESLRSIRLFLRSHGWKPIDERDVRESPVADGPY